MSCTSTDSSPGSQTPSQTHTGGSTPSESGDKWSQTALVYQKRAGAIVSHFATHAVGLANTVRPFDNAGAEVEARAGYVLDNGVGPGAISVALTTAHPHCRIVASDISQGMLDLLDARNLPNVTTRLADAMDLSSSQLLSLTPGGKGFSHAMSNFMIQFVPSPITALREMISVVEPGGVVCVGCWGTTQPVDILAGAAARLDPGWVKPDIYNEKEWPSGDDDSVEQIGQLFEREGLKDVQGRKVVGVLDCEHAEDFVRFYLGMKNPVVDTLIGAWTQRHGPDSVDRLKQGMLAYIEDEGYDARRLTADAIIIAGRKV